MNTYTVQVRAAVTASTTVIVMADSQPEAERIAQLLVGRAPEAYEWHGAGSVEPGDLTSAEAVPQCKCCVSSHGGACCPGWFVNEETRLIERCDSCGLFADDTSAREAARRS
jgi:hypothetical protein